MSDQYHAVCNECGGKGCDECHGGWQCTMEDIGICNKCDMGWSLGEKTIGEKSNERGSTKR